MWCLFLRAITDSFKFQSQSSISLWGALKAESQRIEGSMQCR